MAPTVPAEVLLGSGKCTRFKELTETIRFALVLLIFGVVVERVVDDDGKTGEEWKLCSEWFCRVVERGLLEGLCLILEVCSNTTPEQMTVKESKTVAKFREFVSKPEFFFFFF